MSQSARLGIFSARVRLSTATMSVTPRALRAFTMFEPIKPAAPVTMIMSDAPAPVSVETNAPWRVMSELNPAAPVTMMVMALRSCVRNGWRGSRGAPRDGRRPCRACRPRCPPHGWPRASPPGRSAPAATMRASAAITVSPAPLTSKTSRARVGSRRVSVAVKSDMPSSLRVTMSASSSSSVRSFWARRPRSASSDQRPATSRNSRAVGREDGGAAVTRVIGALRIHQHGLAVGAGQLDHARHVRKTALAIVGKDDRVGFIDQSLELVQLGRQHLVAWRASRSRCAGAAAAARSRAASRSWKAAGRGAAMRAPGLRSAGLQARSSLVVPDHRQQRRLARPARRCCGRRWPRRRAAPRPCARERPAPAPRARCARRRRTSSGRASRRRR